jgi:hypothetical protein
MSLKKGRQVAPWKLAARVKELLQAQIPVLVPVLSVKRHLMSPTAHLERHPLAPRLIQPGLPQLSHWGQRSVWNWEVSL